MGAVFASTRFSLVRISIRDLVADGKSLVRNSGVGGGGQNLILKNHFFIRISIFNIKPPRTTQLKRRFAKEPGQQTLPEGLSANEEFKSKNGPAIQGDTSEST